MSYADAGVNIPLWNKAKKTIGQLVASTANSRVIGGFGHFGGMFDVSFLKKYKNPILVSSVDGVGTKLKIAAEMGIHNTVGEDIVNHCVNDIAVLGAEPIVFLDYIASGKLVPAMLTQVVKGIARACKQNGCVLIGGETAEMPDLYSGADYDIAGTIVGVVDKHQIIDGRHIKKGDVLIGLRSNGLHTNGYSLARKIVTVAAKKKYTDIFPETGKSFGAELLRPHRSYLSVIQLMRAGLIKGCAHITGGGFVDNVNRILPKNCNAHIDALSWEPLPIFSYLQKAGNVTDFEMYRTFNMGVGMVLAVDPKNCSKVLSNKVLAPFKPKYIGQIIPGDGTVEMSF